MPTNRRKDKETDLDYPEGPTEEQQQAAFNASQDGPEDQAANADEARALGDPAPDWATGESAPEVMTSRDQRRAGVLDKMRGNLGHQAEIVPRGEGGAIVVVGPAGAWLESTLRAEMNTETTGAAHAVEDILGRVMNATTAEELFAEDTTLDAKDLIGVPLQIWGFKVNESDIQQGMPGYMVIDAIRRDTGDKVLFTCGGYKVQGQLLRAKTMNMFPVTVHLVSNQTRGGFNALGLVIDK